VLSLVGFLSGCSTLGLNGELGISLDEIDAFVAEEMNQAERAYFRVGGRDIELELADFEDDGLVFSYDGGLLFLGFDLEKEKPDGVVRLLFGKPVDVDGEKDFEVERTFSAKNLVLSKVEESFHIRGEVKDKAGDERIAVDILFNEAFLSAGSSQFRVEGSNAYLTGDLGTRTYRQLKDLIAAHPDLDTLVFEEVPGSVNDAVNVHTGRLVRKAGLTTRIEATGMAASGGVDLFLAGQRRIVQEGARLGVHSWCCLKGKPANQISPSHRGHDSLVAYSTEMLGAVGRGFYFFTLKAAPFDGIHWMTTEEILQWRVATQSIPPRSVPSRSPSPE